MKNNSNKKYKYSKAKRREYKKTFQEKHPEYHRDYMKSHPEKRYIATHPDEWKEYHAAYIKRYRKDPANRMRHSMCNVVSQAIRDGKYIKPSECDDCEKKKRKRMYANFKDELVRSLSRKQRISGSPIKFDEYRDQVIWLCTECHYKKTRKENK